MKDAVLNALHKFNTSFEGFTTWMYLDHKGLVTTGIGNLIDPIGSALSLPWMRPDGSRATQPEIEDAWNTVKARQDLKDAGGGIFRNLTSIRLTDAGVYHVVKNKALQNESILRERFPGFDHWPADAQLGLLSMAWAMGPNFNFPKFQAAVNQLAPDFLKAAQESHINAPGDKAVADRNNANRTLFTNAAIALKNKLDVEKLHWPIEITEDEVKAGGIGLGSGLLITAVGWGLYKWWKG